MNKDRVMIVIAGVIVVLACSVVTGGQPSQVAPAIAIPEVTFTPIPTLPPLPTYTPYPTPTVPPTVAALASPAPAALPQEWSGIYNQTGYGKVRISLIIEKMNGNEFTGRMLWHETQWYRLTINAAEGEFLQDFGDDFEQSRWSHHPDYESGDRSGTWLKWTETYMISGKSLFTMNGWYYAHIRTDGVMLGIYYFNDTEKIPATDSWELRLED